MSQDLSLIFAAYSLTLSAKRILQLAMSKIDSYVFPKKEARYHYVVTADEYAQVFNLKNPYEEMFRAVERLRSEGWYNFETRSYIDWTDEVIYADGVGEIHIWFGWTTTIHLMGLGEKNGQSFSSYPLFETAPMNSFFAVRLFEMLRVYVDSGWYYVSEKDLREMLDIRYKRYTDFRRYVLVPAVKEINAKTQLRISFDKEPRKPTIRFSIGFNPTRVIEKI